MKKISRLQHDLEKLNNLSTSKQYKVEMDDTLAIINLSEISMTMYIFNLQVNYKYGSKRSG